MVNHEASADCQASANGYISLAHCASCNTLLVFNSSSVFMEDMETKKMVLSFQIIQKLPLTRIFPCLIRDYRLAGSEMIQC